MSLRFKKPFKSRLMTPVVSGLCPLGRKLVVKYVKSKQKIKKENKKKIYKKMISLEECVRKSLATEELWFYLVDMTLTYR